MISSQEAAALYVGVDVHERESQLAIFDASGSLLMEKRVLTSDLESFIYSLLGRSMSR
jgi:hypothetical protein